MFQDEFSEKDLQPKQKHIHLSLVLGGLWSHGNVENDELYHNGAGNEQKEKLMKRNTIKLHIFFSPPTSIRAE